MKIITEYPLWFLVFCLLAGLGYAYFLYRKRNEDLKQVVHYALFAMRFFVVSLLCFFLLNPLIKSSSTFTEKPVVVIAADNSVSIIRNKDSVYYRSTFPAALRKLAEGLSDKYEVKFLRFSKTVEEDSSLDYSGKETDIAAVVSQVRSNYEGKNLGALILASDGLYNTGNNPIYETDKNNFPVYTIALGDTLIQKDAVLKKVNHNATAYIGNQFPVEVQVQATDLAGKEAVVSIQQGGKKLAEQTIKYTSRDHTSILNFLLTADKPGLQRYEASISLSTGETNKDNNSIAFVVDVIDKREKVLILAQAPHPDIAALKQAIEGNQSYEVEVKLAENFSSSLKPYSLVIFHQIELKNPITKRMLSEMATHKTSSWQFARSDFWAFSGMRIGNMSARQNDAEPVINAGFSLFNISNELKGYVKEYPAVACPLANYKLANGTVTLLNQQIGQVQTENPILVFSDEGGQKSALFCGDGLWRWRLHDYGDHENTNIFDELVQKTVQYLSVKADKSFFKVYTHRIINENDAVEFDAEAFNPSYELITDPEVNMIITDEAKKQFNYVFSKTNNGYHLNAGNFPPGNYNYKASVKINNQVYEQKGEFTVKPLLAEYTSLTADHALLYSISKKTGGRLFYPAQTSELEKALLENENIKMLVHEQRSVNDFINLKWLFFILLIFLSVEWFLRKYNGLS